MGLTLWWITADDLFKPGARIVLVTNLHAEATACNILRAVTKAGGSGRHVFDPSIPRDQVWAFSAEKYAEHAAP